MKESARVMNRPTIDEYIAEIERSGRMTAIVREAIEKAKRIQNEFSLVYYIAGGLTGVASDVKARYGLLGDLIADQESSFGYAPHLHGTDPIAHPDVSPEEVRDVDYLFAVVVPDFHLNCWYPMAHGNAIEAGWAEAANIPSVYIVPEGVVLSRLVRGMRNISAVITYVDFKTDGIDNVRKFLATTANTTS